MSEDLNQLPGEPEESGQPSVEAGSSQEAERQPLSETIIPEQPVAAHPQYPPAPEFYTQMPVMPVQPMQPVREVPTFTPPVQGMPVFPPPPGYGYGFPLPPQAQPLPLSQALRELPTQYKKILFKPGVRSFVEEQGKAEWGIIWIQLLFLMFVQVLVSIPLFLAYNQALASNPGMASAGADTSLFSSPAFLLLEIVLEVILVPLAFFIGIGIQYLVARAFKGVGSFKQQTYNQLLFQMPLGIVAAALSLILSTFVGRMMAATLDVSATSSGTIPLLGGPYLLVLLLFDLVSLGISVYITVLNVLSIMAVHRMSGGRAAASVLLPYGVLVLLVLLCVCAVAVIGVMAASSVTH